MSNEKKKISLDFDEICEKGIAGQRKILEAQLAAGVPLSYRDKDDNLVEERPDGTIVILKKAIKENA